MPKGAPNARVLLDGGARLPLVPDGPMRMRAWPSRPGPLPDMPACLCLPDRATASGRPKYSLRADRGRPVAGRARLACENNAETVEFCRHPPRAQEADKNGPLAAGTHLDNHRCGGRKADHLTGLGRAITGRLKQIPMFAQVSSCRKHWARAREGPAARARRSTPLATRRIDPQRPRRTRSRQGRTCS